MKQITRIKQMRWVMLGAATVMLIGVICGSRAIAVNEGRGDEDEIRRMVAKYAKAVDDADTALVSQIWSDSPEVSFIHPLGHEHGLEHIKDNVFRRLMGETFSERKLSVRDISPHAYGDAAWVEFYCDFAAKLRQNGSALATHGRETQVYHKEHGSWRLVHVHYSAMPPTQ